MRLRGWPFQNTHPVLQGFAILPDKQVSRKSGVAIPEPRSRAADQLCIGALAQGYFSILLNFHDGTGRAVWDVLGYLVYTSFQDFGEAGRDSLRVPTGLPSGTCSLYCQ